LNFELSTTESVHMQQYHTPIGSVVLHCGRISLIAVFTAVLLYLIITRTNGTNQNDLTNIITTNNLVFTFLAVNQRPAALNEIHCLTDN